MVDVTLVLATSTGGVGQHVRSLAGHLVGAGHQVKVCGPASTQELFAFTDVGATFAPVEISAGMNPLRDARAIRALKAQLAECDIVHAHGYRAGLVTVFAKPSQTPVVVTWHNILLATGVKHTILAQMEKVVARRAGITLGASEDLVARAVRLGARDARFAPVAAPPLPAATADPAAVRADLGVAPEQPLIVTVGRLHPQKSHDVLIRAAARWQNRTPAPAVVIAGDGPQRAELEALIQTEKSPVQLLGRRSDVADILAAADLAVVTSQWEARQLFAQEALHAGKPLIATAVGGIPGLVGEGAVLIPPHDADALDAAVTTLLDDPVAAAKLAERGQTQAQTWPSEADTAESAAAVYAELLGQVP